MLSIWTVIDIIIAFKISFNVLGQFSELQMNMDDFSENKQFVIVWWNPPHPWNY